MSAKFKKYVGYFIVAVVLIGLGKQCHREAPVSSTKEYFPPEVSSSRSAPLRQGEASPCSRQSPARSSYTESDLWNRPNMTMDGDEGINPADAEPTEYDLMQEDPDLYDFIAD